MKNCRKLFAVAVVTALALSCKDTSTGSLDSGSPAFRLRVTVKNPAGAPVPGLRVSAWNIPPRPGLGKATPRVRVEQISSSTSVGFEAPRAARISLAVFDLDGTVVSKLVERRLSSPGAYQVLFQISGLFGTRVFKCFIAADDTTSGDRVFADSIYMVLWRPDAAVAVLGTTSASGEIETSDSLRFPNVLSLPPLIRTDIDPTPLEVFAIPDSEIIALSDTVAGTSQQFRRTVTKGSNDIQLIWNPLASSGFVQIAPFARCFDSTVHRDSLTLPKMWNLHQNYPNPFN